MIKMSSTSISRLLHASSDEKIICGICGHRYHLPRILPCLHTFCSDCILNMKTYAIKDSSDVLNNAIGWLSTHDISSESFRKNLDIIKPPTEFESPDFHISTLPRGRNRQAKVKLRTPRSRSCCEFIQVEEKTVRSNSKSLNRSNSSRSSRNGNKPDIIIRSRTSFKWNIKDTASPSAASAVVSNQSRIIMCPKCWKEVQVSTTLRELPRNLLAERYVAQNALFCPGSDLTCDLCHDNVNNVGEDNDNKHNSVTARCIDCADNLCALCETAHRRQKKTKHHNLVLLEQSVNLDNNCDSISTVREYIGDELNAKDKYLFSKWPESSNNVPTLKLHSLQNCECLLWNEKHSNIVTSDEAAIGPDFNNLHARKNCQLTQSGHEDVNRKCLQANRSGQPGNSRKARADPRRVIMCLEHQGEEMNMFCVTCEQNVCRDCVMLGHRNHDCQFVSKELFQNQMDDVDRMIQMVVPKVKAVDDQIKSLAQVQIRITERSKKVRDEVNTFMDSFVEAVEKHRMLLRTQVTTLTEDKERSVTLAQLDLQKIRAEVEQTCQFLGELLTSASDVEILSMKKLLTHRLRLLTDVSHETMFKLNGFIRFFPAAKGDVINNFQMFGKIMANQASPADSELHAEGLSTARVSRECATILRVNDCDGLPYDEHDVAIQAWIMYQGKEINLPVTVEHLTDGAYQMEFTPLYEGTNFLHVAINGSSIKGSPFKFNVKAKWRCHVGTWQCSTPLTTNGSKDDTCGHDRLTKGSHNLGCPDRTGGHYWSCCGKTTYSSECPANSSRSSPVRQVTF